MLTAGCGPLGAVPQAALAAVRALEERFGGAVAPDDGLLALEQEVAFRERGRKIQEARYSRM